MLERQQAAGAGGEMMDASSALSQPQMPTAKDDMLGCVGALEAALLPCLPARELQAIDRSPHPSHQIDVERHARDFMESAKKLQLHFVSLLREDRPSRSDMLRKDIAAMEEELKVKTELIKTQEQLIQGWSKQLKEQLDRHKTQGKVCHRRSHKRILRHHQRTRGLRGRLRSRGHQKFGSVDELRFVNWFGHHHRIRRFLRHKVLL